MDLETRMKPKRTLQRHQFCIVANMFRFLSHMFLLRSHAFFDCQSVTCSDNKHTHVLHRIGS